ncbi:4Fe-4S binding protein [Natranaerobius thermophilus]|uniref:Cobyrinic acid ac-diamide synthase n=1 Tax=Natranaerobius thermophilus (strain ATCC BAA-1301 / DSM 18059 / JW/NM-WN-LF) TaxID=457570 RepID=B2A0V3_NATTJ|nr:4Fe-4S binding protein [Natranaerobius thermophilus]ACB85983.1 Cobyrinic acid ac-diamide synthase [Natranaerobius thermophilus JW/NM-WN-LF]
MNITIASGKGGTGKTFLATNLAYVLHLKRLESGFDFNSRVTYLDCDVEEPNGHLFLSPTDVKKENVEITAPVSIDQEKCTGCGECSQICVFNALVSINQEILLFPELCHACGACNLACPNSAIQEGNRSVGTLFHGRGKGVPMHYGAVNQGQGGMTPRMIKEVKKFANCDINILDAPPGTACPAVETVKDSDLCVLVTDLTPFGLHDLKLSVEMCREIGIEPVVVINRSGGEDPGVHDYCQREKLHIIGEIPNDRRIAELYSRGELAVEEFNDYQKMFSKLSSELLQYLNLQKVSIDKGQVQAQDQNQAAQDQSRPKDQSWPQDQPKDQPQNQSENQDGKLDLEQDYKDKGSGEFRELVVISGKGGTGKTSLTASLVSLANKAVVADCDVDASDLPLVLNPNIMEQGDFSGGYLARIDSNECSGCGKCYQVCRFAAITFQEREGEDKQKYQIDPLNCEGCGACRLVCQSDAIKLEPAINGEWYKSKISQGAMSHARLGIAEENSGKLVTLTRTKAKELASFDNVTEGLLDGSPGTGCPVIASLTGTEYAVVVTEPTVSGLHDLERVLELCSHFQVPAGVIINKYDINKEMTETIINRIEELNVNYLGCLPYDEQVTEAQLKGQTIVDYNTHCDTSKKIKEIFSRLSSEVQKY